MLGWLCVVLLVSVGFLALYQWVLALAALLPARPGRVVRERRSRLLLLIPAHDEEAGLSSTLHSIQRANYPPDEVRVVVVADRCHDGTAGIARGMGVTCLERSDGTPGKGAAIAWAMDRLREGGVRFDGLVVVDADTVVDPGLLAALDEGLRSGYEVQQGYNYLSNPWESPFTRIIAVTSVLRNGLFYAGKERLGLSSMLSGTGMCFSRALLERVGWTALSVGEDWEFSVTVLLGGGRIHFNRDARVRATESRGFRQASTQRLRWASGRHAVAAASTLRLLVAGLQQRRLELWDAALTMIAPTYSAQATLALMTFVLCSYLLNDPAWSRLFPWAAAVTFLLAAYFGLGIVLTEKPVRALLGIFLIPVFLPWRVAIELLGMLGYGRTRWVRTSRFSPSR
jgi:cellulose synthase/poly-beta-1,6-N-acetylglucosamine synthase-like glycosyltransferase